MQEDAAKSGLRVDKWLWAARFYKTRGLATAAIEGGKVQVNGQRVKPSRLLRPGDSLTIRRDLEVMTVQVNALTERRGPATVAQTLYTETEESQAARAEAAAERRLQHTVAEQARPSHRPTKKDRREIRRLTGKE